MKIKKYGPEMERMKQAGKSYRQIAEAIGLEQAQVKEYFRTDRKEQRLRGYSRSQKPDELKTKQALIGELNSLRMEVDLLRDFMQMAERK